MLSKTNRLSKNGSFGYVYKHGSPVYGRAMTLICVHNSNSVVRVGFSVNNKIGKAVVRNKVKRRMRGFIATQLSLMKGCQCVFVAKQGIDQMSYDELCAQMRRMLKKADLYKNEEEIDR